MKSRRKIPLVGSDGQPLPERIQRALHDLLPRFNRWFPLQDEAVVTGLLEQAGQRIKEKERKSGPLESLHGFAWTVLHNLGVSELRLSRSKVQLESIGSEEGARLMSYMSSDQHATAIEERLAIEQALAQVTELERRVALLKVAQFTSTEIAEQLGSTDRAVDQAYFRVRHKLKKLLGSQGEC